MEKGQLSFFDIEEKEKSKKRRSPARKSDSATITQKQQLIFDLFLSLEEKHEEAVELRTKFAMKRNFDYERAISRAITKEEKIMKLESLQPGVSKELELLKFYRVDSFADCLEFAHDVVENTTSAGKTKGFEFEQLINLERALAVTALYCVFNDYNDFIFTEKSFCEILEDDDRFIETMREGINFVKIVEKTSFNKSINFETAKDVDMVDAFNNRDCIAEYFRDKFQQEHALRGVAA